MGVIRVHGILPVNRTMFILSKLSVFLVSDLAFAALLTVINLGLGPGAAVLPAVLLQAGILSLIMALIGFFCAVRLPDFKQFSLLYLVLAVFITACIPGRPDRRLRGLDRLPSHVPSVHGHERRVFFGSQHQIALLCRLSGDDSPAVPSRPPDADPGNGQGGIGRQHPEAVT